MEIIRLEASATMEDVIVAFNKLSESYANEVAVLQQRLDAAGRVCKDLQRKLKEITGPTSTEENVQSKMLITEDTNKTITYVFETLRSSETSIDQKIEAVGMAEQIISNGMGSEAQRKSLTNYVNNFWIRHPKLKKNKKTLVTSSSISDEQREAYANFGNEYNNFKALEETGMQCTEGYRLSAIRCVDWNNKIQGLIDKGDRLPTAAYDMWKKYTTGSKQTKGTDYYFQKMLDIWAENNDNKTMDGNDGGGEKTTA
jgi:hypothetical protein